MNRFVNVALKCTEKSEAGKHKHGAVCVMGGKVVSSGYNHHSRPHLIKVQQPLF